MKKLIAVCAVVSAIALTGCEDVKEVQEQASKAEETLKQAWQDAVAEVQKHSEAWNNQEVNDLVKEAKALALVAKEEGQDQVSVLLEESRKLALEAWDESKDQAGELNEEALAKFEELKAKIAEAKAKLEAQEAK
jgi:LAS superfamily LD-carboxypeptidase LdcB